MVRHVFLFDGGEKLTTMGAAWFVSYCYFNKIDNGHKNWQNVSTYQNRASVYKSTAKYHTYWLKKVLDMDDYNLNKNAIDLNAGQIKKMAEHLLNNVK